MITGEIRKNQSLLYCNNITNHTVNDTDLCILYTCIFHWLLLLIRVKNNFIKFKFSFPSGNEEACAALESILGYNGVDEPCEALQSILGYNGVLDDPEARAPGHNKDQKKSNVFEQTPFYSEGFPPWSGQFSANTDKFEYSDTDRPVLCELSATYTFCLLVTFV